MLSEGKLKILAQAPSPTEMQKIKHTKDMIYDALQKYLPIDEIKKRYALAGFKYEVYLQGSYANNTNISFESDVDIVVQLNTIFWSDKSQISELEKLMHEISYSSSQYQFKNFKDEVFAALKLAFGQDAEYSDKCIIVKANTNRVKADVVPAFQYRVYKRFISYDDHSFVEGMKFIDTTSLTEIINFPKIHLKNCELKNIATDESFKSIIRIFKNIRQKLIDSNQLSEKSASPFYIENLLYNCTDSCFEGNYTLNMLKTLQFLFDAFTSGRAAGFICAHEQASLFGGKNWNLVDGQKFIITAGKYFLNET